MTDRGPDSYWHKRSNGTDALAMFLHESVPLVRDRVGQPADFHANDVFTVRAPTARLMLSQLCER
jgi:hypothetical protein